MKRKIILTGIIRYIDEYLVVQRAIDDDFLPGVWEFPGGNIENGELIFDALNREIYEEVGLDISAKAKKIINFYDEIKEKKGKYHYIELDFLIDVDSKDLNIRLSAEHENYMWVKKDSNLIDKYIRNKIKNL